MSAPRKHRNDKEADALTLPHEVMSRHLLEGVSLVRAWREHLGRTQGDVAEALAVTQAQIAQWEAPDAHPRHTTLKRIAESLGLHVSQLTLAGED
jgi:predicted transcriptional regulator